MKDEVIYQEKNGGGRWSLGTVKQIKEKNSRRVTGIASLRFFLC